MVSLKEIERTKTDIIKNFKPEEFEIYLKSLINLYYESFLIQDREKHLAVTKLIEEAVDVYETKYTNTAYNRLVYEVNKANDLLTETLIEKEELAKARRYFLSEYYSQKIYYLIHNNTILKDLIEVYEKEPSEILLENTKHILLEKEVPEDFPFIEDLNIMKEFYSEFLELQKKINSF